MIQGLLAAADELAPTRRATRGDLVGAASGAGVRLAAGIDRRGRAGRSREDRDAGLGPRRRAETAARVGIRSAVGGGVCSAGDGAANVTERRNGRHGRAAIAREADGRAAERRRVLAHEESSARRIMETEHAVVGDAVEVLAAIRRSKDTVLR